MEENNNPQMMPKPDNNLVLAIFSTVCCCLPLGIVAIIKACSVNTLYAAGNYVGAVKAAEEAKKWSNIGIILGIVASLAYFFFALFAGR